MDEQCRFRNSWDAVYTVNKLENAMICKSFQPIFIDQMEQGKKTRYMSTNFETEML